jgi:cellulose synthase/poly-beta-1,6-N-acetylglucosamine synthase-like glycosyltransferase
MDADVVFTALSLRRMARHLADPEVGAVTAYIKEGSEHQNGVRRAISFEYAVSQAGARRAQNVLGAIACLAGGAQLHSRESLESIGGAIDTSTLAEDTVTTLLTQLDGRRVIFEPNAIVWAEEPETIDGLWKQRVRWARGNVQVTRKFEKVWFRRSKAHGLGGVLFGLLWFTTLMLPVFMIASSLALVILWLVSSDLAFRAFEGLWILNGLSFVFLILLTLLIDPAIARRTWRRAVMFPGLISVTIVLATCFPAAFRWIGDRFEDAGWTFNHSGERIVLLGLYLWVSLCMLAAYALVKLERAGARRIAAVGLWFVGYGPLLCAITLTAYIKEMRGAAQVWEKTLKTGQVAVR